jgi:hypothetical protein
VVVVLALVKVAATRDWTNNGECRRVSRVVGLGSVQSMGEGDTTRCLAQGRIRSDRN